MRIKEQREFKHGEQRGGCTDSISRPWALTTNFVGCDDVMVGELATRHVVEIGRTRIAHIGGKGASPSVDRLKGHRNALAAADLQMPKNYIVTVEHFEDAGDSTGYQAMRELLGLKVRPDAVFCYNDLSAIGAMQAAMDAGFRIPEYIAFVGCGNLRYTPTRRSRSLRLTRRRIEWERFLPDLRSSWGMETGAAAAGHVARTDAGCSSIQCLLVAEVAIYCQAHFD